MKLLHGQAWSQRSMAPIARDLERAGYKVRNVGYPSRANDVAGLVAHDVRPAVGACDTHRPIHVVTHSLGGLPIRYDLQHTALPPGSQIRRFPAHGYIRY